MRIMKGSWDLFGYESESFVIKRYHFLLINLINIFINIKILKTHTHTLSNFHFIWKVERKKRKGRDFIFYSSEAVSFFLEKRRKRVGRYSKEENTLVFGLSFALLEIVLFAVKRDSEFVIVTGISCGYLESTFKVRPKPFRIQENS